MSGIIRSGVVGNDALLMPMLLTVPSIPVAGVISHPGARVVVVYQ